MIDRELKQRVSDEVDAIDPAHGDLGAVLQRGRRRQNVTRLAGAAAVLLIAVGLVAVASRLPADEAVAPSPSFDMVLTVNPGEGPGPLAESLAGSIGPEVVQGTAEHVGWVATDFGRSDLVIFRANDPNPFLGNEEFSTCIGVVSTESSLRHGSCNPGDQHPVLSGGYGLEGGLDGFVWIHELAPEHSTRVVVVTQAGKTIEVTGSRHILVVWPRPWGPPESLTAYDRNGQTLGSVEYTDASA